MAILKFLMLFDKINKVENNSSSLEPPPDKAAISYNFFGVNLLTLCSFQSEKNPKWSSK
jgi:hypothetical protein